jgi:[ribosomal protein S18]-alanine N-acetyltransferase
MKIRNATSDDALLISLIQDETLDEKWGERGVREMIEKPTILGLILKNNSNTIGYLLYTHLGSEVQILSFAVQLDHQKIGCGQKLWDHLETILKQQSAKTIFLEVNESNQQAIVFYEKNGLKQIALRKKYYNNTDDAIVMQKIMQASF